MQPDAETLHLASVIEKGISECGKSNVYQMAADSEPNNQQNFIPELVVKQNTPTPAPPPSGAPPVSIS